MHIYLAGPLFAEAERGFIESLAGRLEAAGMTCFVPHRQKLDNIDPTTIYAADATGLRGANAVVAWLDGPNIDDGTACEIGMFAQCCEQDPERYRGIVGLATDWRTSRMREAGAVGHGLNLFVVGAIEAHGSIVFSVDDVVEALTALS